MNLRKALLMAVILLSLGAYIYFVELPQEKAEASKKKLYNFDKDAVTQVTLTYPDRVVQLQKNAMGKWQITQPVETEADDPTVTNLVNAIAEAEVIRTLDDAGQDLSLYGLTAPVVKVQVALKDGKTLPQALVGKDTPVGFSVYVQKEGNPQIFLTPQAFRLGMTKEVKDLRDKTIVSFNNDEVKKIEIQGQEKGIVLSKADAGWRVEKPVSGKADDSQVQTFLANVQGLRAQDFIEQPTVALKELGLAPPQLRISLTVGPDDSKKILLVGNEKAQEKDGKQRYVKREEKETLFLVGDWVFRDLNKTTDDFRDKTVAKFSQDQATKIAVQRQDGQGFTLTRGTDKKWTIDKTGDGNLKEAAFSQFVSALSDLRGFEIAADSPTDLAAYGLAPPTVTISAYDEKNEKLAAVQVGQKAEGDAKKTFSKSEAGSTVFAVRDYVFERLNKTPADFWEKPTEKKEGPPSSASPPSSEDKSEGLTTSEENDEEESD